MIKKCLILFLCMFLYPLFPNPAILNIQTIKKSLYDIQYQTTGRIDLLQAELLLLALCIEALEERKEAILYCLRHPEKLNTKEKILLLKLVPKKFQVILYKIKELEEMFSKKKEKPQNLVVIFQGLKNILSNYSQFQKHKSFYFNFNPLIFSGITAVSTFIATLTSLSVQDLLMQSLLMAPDSTIAKCYFIAWATLLYGSLGAFGYYLEKYIYNKISFSKEEEQLWKNLAILKIDLQLKSKENNLISKVDKVKAISNQPPFFQNSIKVS